MVATLAELDRLVRERGFDTGRQYVYGDSMGAEGVFQLLAKSPDRFAAAVAVSGYTTATDAAAMAKTPLWIIHGSADSVNAVQSVRTIYASILAAGGMHVKYTEYDGLDHVATIVRAVSEPGLVAWILAQRRP
jgi:predicted peptidase